MRKIAEIKALTEIAQYAPSVEGWKDAEKFNSRGKKIGDVEIIAKKQRTIPYSTCDRISRFALGLLLGACSFGILLLFKPVRNLIIQREVIHFGLRLPSKRARKKGSNPAQPASSPQTPSGPSKFEQLSQELSRVEQEARDRSLRTHKQIMNLINQKIEFQKKNVPAEKIQPIDVEIARLRKQFKDEGDQAVALMNSLLAKMTTEGDSERKALRTRYAHVFRPFPLPTV